MVMTPATTHWLGISVAALSHSKIFRLLPEVDGIIHRDSFKDDNMCLQEGSKEQQCVEQAGQKRKHCKEGLHVW